jgi:hypothetical protein
MVSLMARSFPFDIAASCFSAGAQLYHQRGVRADR